MFKRMFLEVVFMAEFMTAWIILFFVVDTLWNGV